jgi:hypothetical protein
LSVDIPDTEPVKLPMFDEVEDFCGGGNLGLGQTVEKVEDLATLREMTESELTGNPGMSEHRNPVEEAFKDGVTDFEVVDPDRRVDQDQPGWP